MPDVKRGDVFQMNTGEEVEVTFTRYYATPQGDTEQHAVRMLRQHTFQGTREVGERVVPEWTTRQRGTTYHLTTNELLNNGRLVVGAEAQQLRRSA